MFVPSHTTTDVVTNVTISSNDSSIPLDTKINAKQLLSGTEYEKIIDILKLNDNLMFDLKLFSNGLDKYITKLENGEFEVRIPIPDNYKEKDLVVYYVTSNGEIEEYNVELDKNKEYAVFKTNHFSIYTLAEKKVENTITDNKIENTPSNKTESIPNVPATIDNISTSILISLLSFICLLITNKYLKKVHK